MVSGSSASEDRSGDGCNDSAHPDLRRLRLRLQEILEAICSFEPPVRLPPVLDVSLATDDPSRVAGKTPLPGLRGLEESVRRDLEVLTKVCEDIVSGALGSGLMECTD